MSIKYGRERLSSEYQEVEYIESDGNAYVNLGILAKDVVKINLQASDFAMGSSYADQYSYVVFGTTANSWRCSSTYYTYNGSRFRYHMGLSNRPYFDCTGTQSGAKNDIEYTLSGFTVNGVVGSQVGTDTSRPDASNNAICFWYCGNNSHSKYKMYSLKITDTDGEHNYIPCYRKSDDVIGLYSLEDEEFYTNAGSGTFTKGNDIILKDLQERYIGPITEQVENYLPQTMTQLEQDGFVASGSSTLGDSSDYWRGAFFVSTQGGTDHCFHSSQIGAGNRAYSQIQLPGEIVVDKIEIGARKNESSTNLREIRAFILKGSNDGTNWTEIKSVDGLGSSWSIGTVLSWNIEGQTTAYKYLKLEVQANREYVAFDYRNVGGEVTKIKKVTEVYIGNGDSTATKIRPATEEFYYNFVGNSISGMQNDGWTATGSGSREITGNGLHNNSTNFGNRDLTTNLDFSNVKTITITRNIYLQSGSRIGGSSINMNDGTNSMGAYVSGMTNSGYNGYNTGVPSNSVWNRTNVATGNYEVVFTVDLVNKTASMVLPGYSTLTLTLSDSDVTYIKGMNSITLGYDNIAVYVKDVHILGV